MTRPAEATSLQLELHNAHKMRQEAKIISLMMREAHEIIAGSSYKPSPRVNEIINSCCSHYGVRRIDVLSHRRSSRLVRVRQCAMYLARMLTTYSLPEIGRIMDRDHTTIMHGISKIEQRLPIDFALQADVEAIRGMLGA